MQIDERQYLDFSDVLIKPKRSTLTSRSEVDINRTFKCKHSGVEWTGVPIIAANMDTIATFEMAKELSKYNMLTAIHKHYSLAKWQSFINRADDKLLNDIFVSSGISDEDLEILDKILNLSIKLNKICLDVANGYTERFVQVVKKVRAKHPDKIIMAGNIVTYEMTEELLLAGASIVKGGIGGGSACTTRKMTGIGMPQLSMIIECADAAHGLDGLLCSDGGCTVPGDVVKAFAAGADFVMIGGMLSGHKECAGDLIEDNGELFKLFYGMSSKVAIEKHYGGVKNYRAEEGKAVKIPYKGEVEPTIINILGGLRSACTYVGAKQLKNLSKRTTFIRVNNQLNGVFS